jgi:hypothetical protein
MATSAAKERFLGFQQNVVLWDAVPFGAKFSIYITQFMINITLFEENISYIQ